MYMTQGLHRALQQNPAAIAIRCGGREVTYKAFVERVARLAAALQAHGMQAGDRVAMLALNSDRYLEYQFGVPWGGGVLNPCNIRWSAAEIIYSLQDSASSILLVDDAFVPMAGQIVKEAASVRHVIYVGQKDTPPGMLDYEELLLENAPVDDVCRRGNDLAGIFYTGGTTGFPKGVMLSHANLCSSALIGIAEGVGQAGEVYLHAAPMFHLADIGKGLMHWMLGNTHAIVPVFSPEAVLASIARDRVSDMMVAPVMLQMLVDHPAMKTPPDLSSLKHITYGGSPISDAVIERAMKALPGVELIQGYGMTELAPIATLNHAWHHCSEGRKAGKPGSAGRATFGVDVKIVDEDGDEVARGVLGEVVVRGANVMLGYWNKPAETTAAIRDGWMRTGDGAYMDDDGFIFIVDRLKDMIISGGENVYSIEVENTIGRHHAVAACAVIGIPDPAWGEAVHAVIVVKPGADASSEEIITFCKSRIAGYKCPRSIAFAHELPLSGAGKVLKNKLREPFWAGRGNGIG